MLQLRKRQEEEEKDPEAIEARLHLALWSSVSFKALRGLARSPATTEPESLNPRNPYIQFLSGSGKPHTLPQTSLIPGTV